MAPELKIGFLGAGKMATALAKGFVQAKLVRPEDLIASDPIEGARQGFAREVGGKATASNPDVLQFANVIILAVKPDQVNDVLSEARRHITEKHLIISIAAGVPIARIETNLPPGARVIRVMPNTPALVGASA